MKRNILNIHQLHNKNKTMKLNSFVDYCFNQNAKHLQYNIQ